MAASTACYVLPHASCLSSIKSLRNSQMKKSFPSSKFPCIRVVSAVQLQSTPAHTENLAVKSDSEDVSPRVFADETKGIVCYRTESGEIVCEGFDEGPQFYPPCGANFYMPDTRAATILPLLGEVMYEI